MHIVTGMNLLKFWFWFSNLGVGGGQRFCISMLLVYRPHTKISPSFSSACQIMVRFMEQAQIPLKSSAILFSPPSLPCSCNSLKPSGRGMTGEVGRVSWCKYYAANLQDITTIPAFHDSIEKSRFQTAVVKYLPSGWWWLVARRMSLSLLSFGLDLCLSFLRHPVSMEAVIHQMADIFGDSCARARKNFSKLMTPELK